MKLNDFILLSFIIICFMGFALTVHTKYTELTYKYNRELKNYIRLNKDLKKHQIQLKSLSAPKRIINFAQEKLGLHLPKLNEVYHIDK